MPHKIDIVIPCYNYAHFLDDCLNAVLAQTRTDFSVLLMDNASTDNTAAVAATWMQRDPRIQYQRNESNIGAVGNMQRGYELTAAEYVVILPADDLWEPSFLARTCDALDQHPECSYAYTGWGTCRQAGDLLGKMTTVPHQNDGVVEDMPFLTLQNYIPLSFGVFRRSMCVKAGGVYPRFLPMLGDLYLWMRLSAEGPSYFVNQQLGRLRFHGENTSHELHATGRSAYDQIHLLDLVFESERWSKPIRLLAKARQMQLLTGEKISTSIRALGNDKTLPIIQAYIKPERIDLYLIAAIAIRGYPEAVSLTDTANDADDLLSEVIDNAPADSDFNVIGDKAGQANAISMRQLNSAYEQWLSKRSFISEDIQVIVHDIDRWRTKPVFQILIRLTETDKAKLADTLESLNHQFYGNWRVDIVTTLPAPAGIDGVTNVGWHNICSETQSKATLDLLQAAHGCDWILEAPPGTILDPLCLWRIGHEANRTPDAVAFYVDDDLTSVNGKRTTPRFKGGVNVEWVHSADILGPFFLSRKAARRAGGVAEEASSAWYDLLLRVLEAFERQYIEHIPDVLLSYRDVFPSNQDVCMHALARHLTRLGVDANVSPSAPKIWRVTYQHDVKPMVSIIIPSADSLEFIEPCIKSILDKTAYPDYEIIIITNLRISDQDTQQYLSGLARSRPDRIRILDQTETPSISKAYNLGAQSAIGNLLILLKEDTRIIQEHWLDELLAHGLRPNVAAVSPRIVQPRYGMIENAGYVLGMLDEVGAPYRGTERYSAWGLMDMLQVTREISAAPITCLMVKKHDFFKIDGLDDKALPNRYADIELSLKLSQQCGALIYTPAVTIVHYGDIANTQFPLTPVSVAHSTLQEAEAKVTIQQRWKRALSNDVFWSPNLGLRSEAPTIEPRALPVWRYLPGDSPRLLARPLDNGQGLYRLTQPMRALRYAGLAQACEIVQGGEQTLSPREIARIGADSYIVQIFLNDPRLRELHLYRKYAPEAFIVYSCDDLLTHMPLKSAFRNNVPANTRARFKAALRDCNRLVVSTDYLAEAFANLIDDIKVIPNRLERETWLTLSGKRRTSRRPRIGWAGGTGHQGDLELVKPVIEATHNEADWIFFGMCPEEIRPLLTEYHELVAFDDYPAKLAALNLDLAIAPLEDIPFNHGKSNLRLLEYGALGLPVICSDVTPYRNSPALCLPNDPQRWIAALRERIHDLDAAELEGLALRRWVLRDYVLEEHLDEWLEAHLPESAKSA